MISRKRGSGVEDICSIAASVIVFSSIARIALPLSQPVLGNPPQEIMIRYQRTGNRRPNARKPKTRNPASFTSPAGGGPDRDSRDRHHLTRFYLALRAFHVYRVGSLLH